MIRYESIAENPEDEERKYPKPFVLRPGHAVHIPNDPEKWEVGWVDYETKRAGLRRERKDGTIERREETIADILSETDTEHMERVVHEAREATDDDFERAA